LWAVGGAVYIIGALIYVFRIPERWYPMKFDKAGSSHNIFHLAVVAGCGIHFAEALDMYMNR
jgi:adiponectin receptor